MVLLGWQNAFTYDLLVVFGPQLLLDMWLPRSIGCSRGCGMSSCNHACESLLAWICWCGLLRRGFVRCGFVLGVDFLAWNFWVWISVFLSTTKPPNRCGRMHQQIHVLFSPQHPPQEIHPKIHPLLLSGPATAAAVTFHSHVRTIGCRAP